MANHKSAIKRIRQSETRRLRNRYYSKTMRNAVRNIRKMTDAKEAKAGNLKSKLAQHINKLNQA